MKVELFWTADEVDPSAVRGHGALVIDVLRATTMMARLLERGAAAIYPVAAIEEAKALAERLGPQALLAGERGGVRPEGFHLGNSPLEVDPGLVAARDVVMTTTNGTRAAVRCREAKSLAAAAFVNAAAAVGWALSEAPERLFLVCAGTDGAFSLEDALCAGLLASRLERAGAELASDASVAASLLYRQAEEELAAAVRRACHARRLERLGFGADIDFALAIDAIAALPVRERGPGGLDRMVPRRPAGGGKATEGDGG